MEKLGQGFEARYGPCRDISILRKVLLHNLQNQATQPGLGMRNRSKSDRSQRSRRNKVQDVPKTQYRHKLCSLHAMPNHTNQECRRQKAWPCPMHGQDNHAVQCSRSGDYLHIPNMAIYSSDSDTAQILCRLAGGVITPSDRPTKPQASQEMAPGNFYLGPSPQYPPAAYNYAPWAMAPAPKIPTAPPGPGAYRPPLYQPRQAHPMDLASNAPMQLNHIPSHTSPSNPSLPGPSNAIPSNSSSRSYPASLLGEKFSELSNLLKGHQA